MKAIQIEAFGNRLLFSQHIQKIAAEVCVPSDIFWC